MMFWFVFLRLIYLSTNKHSQYGRNKPLQRKTRFDHKTFKAGNGAYEGRIKANTGQLKGLIGVVS